MTSSSSYSSNSEVSSADFGAILIGDSILYLYTHTHTGNGRQHSSHHFQKCTRSKKLKTNQEEIKKTNTGS